MPDAAKGAETPINASNGAAAIEAPTLAGAANLSGKALIDVSNPLDHAKFFPPGLLPAYNNRTSLGEQIQAAFPDAQIVKAFNTMTAALTVNPAFVPGPQDLFIAGNSADAKATVTKLAQSFGWTEIVDLGGIIGARRMDGILPLFLSVMMLTGKPLHNLHLQRA